MPVSGPKVCFGWWVGGGGGWVCKPISVLSFDQAEQHQALKVNIAISSKKTN